MEDRAVEIAGGSRTVTLGLYASHANDGKRELLERRGFRRSHTVLRFKIDLAQPSHRSRSAPPDGIVASARYSTDDRTRCATRWAKPSRVTGGTRRAASTSGSTSALRHPAFDPQLWRVAECEGEVVGATLVYDVGETGYLSNVGVRRAWRGKGVAQALVADAFEALRERGQMRVLVSVDADAAPAAIHLYEEAGMRVHERHDWFVKTLAGP